MTKRTQFRRAMAFFGSIAALATFLCMASAQANDIIIADFDENTYGKWAITGQAFGQCPAHGTLPNQMAVTGYKGQGLVNSFCGGDAATGTLTSPQFTVQRKYINFLIGGGMHPGQTCINLLIGDKIVRTATGPNDRPRGTERLRWQSWNVSDLIGQAAEIQIVDNCSGSWGHINIDNIVQGDKNMQSKPLTRTLKATRRYLHIPVKNGAEIQKMTIAVAGKPVRNFDIELAEEKPDFWVFCDVSEFRGKELTISCSPADSETHALDSIRQSDQMPGSDQLYSEPLRPQFHFSSIRGWLNDPNGLIYYDGEYHLFYQHNPYGTNWGNMHWGHAVSKDLMHWHELPSVLYPWTQAKEMCFSGSAVVDQNNTAGFQTGKEEAIVAIFTDTGQGESLAFSNDKGRTFTCYSQNPILKHSGRDPKVFWYAPDKHWSMVVYDEREGKTGVAFYTSTDLKTWTFEGWLEGYYECPELFELPVDGNNENTRWVLFAADAKYAIGSFNGKVFTPSSEGKYQVHFGNYYASQTYNGTPDGRRIQIGWAQINMEKMPFNNMMSFPTELSLKTTEDGIRMFVKPIDEIETLHGAHFSRTDSIVAEGKSIQIPVSGQLFDIRAEFDVNSPGKFGIEIGGTEVTYDAAKHSLMDAPLKPVNGKIQMQLLIDRCSLEICGNDGRVYITLPFRAKGPISSVNVFSSQGSVHLTKLDVYGLKATMSEEK